MLADLVRKVLGGGEGQTRGDNTLDGRVVSQVKEQDNLGHSAVLLEVLTEVPGSLHVDTHRSEHDGELLDGVTLVHQTGLSANLGGDLVVRQTSRREERNLLSARLLLRRTPRPAPVETVEPVAANTEAEDEALLEPNPPPAALKSAELAGLGTKLGPARQLASTDPWAAIELYRDSLAAVGVGLPEADEIGVSATVPKRGVAPLRKMAVASALTQVLDEAAELYTASWQHSAALATLQLSHKIRRRVKPLGAVPAAEMALSAAGLASAYGRSLRYAEALATLRSIAPLEASLPPQAVAVLLKQEGSLHECASDFVSALQRHEEAAQALGHPSSGDPNDLGTHKGLATLLFESGYAYI